MPHLPKISENETARYLGYRGATPDETVAAEIRECIRLVEEAAVPASSALRVPVSFSDDGVSVTLGKMRVESSALRRNLAGCGEAVMFAATVGIGVDRLIKRYEVTKPSRALVLQAVGAAAVEAVCDELNEEVARAERAAGRDVRPRFSPGYGDFALSHQGEFLAMLGGSRIGISLTEGNLMIPSKSVTAVIGVTGAAEQGCPQKYLA